MRPWQKWKDQLIGDMFDFLSKEIIRLQVGIPQMSFRHNKLVQ